MRRVTTNAYIYINSTQCAWKTQSTHSSHQHPTPIPSPKTKVNTNTNTNSNTNDRYGTLYASSA